MEVSFASAVSQKSPYQQNANRKKYGGDHGSAAVRMAVVIVLYVTRPEIALFKFRAPYRKQPDSPRGFLCKHPRDLRLGLLSGSTIAQDLLSHSLFGRLIYSLS